MHNLGELDAVVTHLGGQSLRRGAGNHAHSEAAFRLYLEAVKHHLDGAGSRYNVEWQPAAYASNHPQGLTGRTYGYQIEKVSGRWRYQLDADGQPIPRSGTVRLDAAITEPIGPRPATLDVMFPNANNPVRVGYDISYHITGSYGRGGAIKPPKSLIETYYGDSFGSPIRDLRMFPGNRVFQLEEMNWGRGHGYAEYILYEPPNMFGLPELTPRFRPYATLESYIDAVGWAHRVDPAFLAQIVGRR